MDSDSSITATAPFVIPSSGHAEHCASSHCIFRHCCVYRKENYLCTGVLRHGITSLGVCSTPFSQSLLHGSPEAKKAGEVETQQHSRLIGRGKYIHAFESAFWLAFGFSKIIDALNPAHRVKPDRTDEYKKAA